MNHSARLAAAAALGGLVVVALLAAGPMMVRADGLEFPDGTIQQTAATAPQAWPMHCRNSVFSPGIQPIWCSSQLPGAGAVTDSNGGVPAGHALVVTDVMVSNQSELEATGDARIDIYVGSGCDAGGTSWSYVSTIRLIGNIETRAFTFTAPLRVLTTGQCLGGAASQWNSPTTLHVHMLGYLTDDPLRFRP